LPSFFLKILFPFFKEKALRGPPPVVKASQIKEGQGFAKFAFRHRKTAAERGVGNHNEKTK